MLFISHRGNLHGISTLIENHPSVIDNAICLGLDVEIDIMFIDGQCFLGHDVPMYPVEFSWLVARQHKLWIHCKNSQAFIWLCQIGAELNFFWHDTDKYTFTSRGTPWCLAGQIPCQNSILLLPEKGPNHVELSKSIDFWKGLRGVCTDEPIFYKRAWENMLENSSDKS